MSQVIFKRGTSESFEKEPLRDGLLSFTIDDGKIHLDYVDENQNIKRKTFYSGKLFIGPYTYDGTEDVTIATYDGKYDDIN